eukprot:CAMPEP_0119306118 /NCGR_PEP_ID=MMETSP1333-20130426/6943_1 /TAXON_ID=418940 /ORGANISM="Scyphosphaera apsteinii, Strain RCC1455" /LENGTH=220 /DNA_ID=CAMNT_0007309345 /DNA_START=287 /DNA_END=949 /DNA_ORIENTATION=-
MTSGIKIILVHEVEERCGGCPFSRFFQVTPDSLVQGGLYKTIAVPMHTEPYRIISLTLLAKELGASIKKKGFLKKLRKSSLCRHSSIRDSVSRAPIDKLSETVGSETVGSETVEDCRRPFGAKAPLDRLHNSTVESSKSNTPVCHDTPVEDNKNEQPKDDTLHNDDAQPKALCSTDRSSKGDGIYNSHGQGELSSSDVQLEVSQGRMGRAKSGCFGSGPK